MVISNSFCLQWGRKVNAKNEVNTVSFPVSFTAVYAVITNGGVAGENNANSEYDTIGQPYNFTTTGFSYRFQNTMGKKTCQFISVGKKN